MKQVFEDGSVLLTGDDFTRAIDAMLNRRGNYDISCSFCQFEDSEICKDCTITNDTSCSCHISPPCSRCVGSKFEVSPYLLNYKHYVNGKTKWECFKGNKTTFEKLTKIEEKGFNASAEILTTGEISITIEDNFYDYDIDICQKPNFKQAMINLINRQTKLKHFLV